jgi:hypothetical protein
VVCYTTWPEVGQSEVSSSGLRELGIQIGERKVSPRWKSSCWRNWRRLEGDFGGVGSEVRENRETGNGPIIMPDTPNPSDSSEEFAEEFEMEVWKSIDDCGFDEWSEFSGVR